MINDKTKQNKNSFLKLTKINILFFLLIIFFFIQKKNDIKKKGNKKKKSEIKVGMCTIAKKENRYIKYFVEFYKNLGYNHIFFYDNNDEGDESISDLQIVKEGVKTGFISITKFNKKKKRFITGSYYDCYEKHNLEFDWISFFDIDEFLILEPNNSSIQGFLSNPLFNNCESVKFNWRVFTDNDQIDYIDKPLMERFPIETKFKWENRHVKSTFRGRLNYKKFKKNYSAHSIYDNVRACTSSGKKTDSNFYFWPPDFEKGSLNHYVTKSIREFFYKKYKTKINVDEIPEKTKYYLFDYFFKINKKSKEKVDIFNHIFHTNYH